MNIHLLNKVLDLIDTTPDKWYQGAWIDSEVLSKEQLAALDKQDYSLCGATACVAGWAMLLSEEYRPLLSKHRERSWVHDMVRAEDDKSLVEIAREEYRQSVDVEMVYINEGARLLDIPIEKARHIFINMDYRSHAPHTFTDNVRTYLGLPTKHGTVVGLDGRVVRPADGEELGDETED